MTDTKTTLDERIAAAERDLMAADTLTARTHAFAELNAANAEKLAAAIVEQDAAAVAGAPSGAYFGGLFGPTPATGPEAAPTGRDAD